MNYPNSIQKKASSNFKNAASVFPDLDDSICTVAEHFFFFFFFFVSLLSCFLGLQPRSESLESCCLNHTAVLFSDSLHFSRTPCSARMRNGRKFFFFFFFLFSLFSFVYFCLLFFPALQSLHTALIYPPSQHAITSSIVVNQMNKQHINKWPRMCPKANSVHLRNTAVAASISY